MTPESATTNAVTLASRMRSISVSIPAMNIKTMAPDLRQQHQGPVAWPSSNMRRCRRLTAPGPSSTPTSSSPRMAGIPKRVHREAASLPAGSNMASNSAS